MNDNNNSAYRTDRNEGGSWWKILLAVLAVLVILGVIIAFAMHNKKKNEGVTNPNPSTSMTTSHNDLTLTTTSPATSNPEELDTRGTLGAHTVEIKSHQLVKEENGKDAILITYEIENGDSKTMNFLTFLSDTAYQGTHKLSDAVLKDVEAHKAGSISEDIEPNGKREVTRAFLLHDTDTPVKAMVKQLVTTDDRIVTRTFDIK